MDKILMWMSFLVEPSKNNFRKFRKFHIISKLFTCAFFCAPYLFPSLQFRNELNATRTDAIDHFKILK